MMGPTSCGQSAPTLPERISKVILDPGLAAACMVAVLAAAPFPQDMSAEVTSVTGLMLPIMRMTESIF